ncbi:MAG: PKD domain-containing protein [Ferruginibacter sp.]
MTNAAGTKDSIIKTQYITVFALPTVNFTATPLTGCYPLPVQFTDNSIAGSGTITGWLWDFGDGNSSVLQNPSHIYTAAGNYNVSLRVTNSNGCDKTLTRTNYISITTGVEALFTNTVPQGCVAPETITFQNQSTGTGVLSYQWNFGDGGTSVLSNPVHTYNTPGSFSVQLIVTNSTGCTDTVIHSNTINIGTVTAGFTAPATACAGSPINLTNTSTPPPISVQWTFGDATGSTAGNPVKIYSTPGLYTIKLVSNFGGCQDSVTQNIQVLAKPMTAFAGSPLVSCKAPHNVTFTNSSTGAISSQWSFGDGTTSAAVNPSHTYTTPGNYDVMLVTVNANGCTDTLIKTAYVTIQLPIATINNLPDQGCAPLTHTFSASVTSSEPVTGYQWNFGDGTTSTAPNPTHVYPPGIYDVQLIITTASGCTDTVMVVGGIKSMLKPVAAFMANPQDVCAEIPVIFVDQSTGTITSWEWIFGDGGTSSDQNPVHTYEDTGYFDITLIVSNNGCNDTLVLNDYIHIKPPIAIFTVNPDCINHFTRTFTDASIGADQWNWNFGDGNTSTTQSPVHTYTAVGTYTITLTVTNNQTGCSYTKTTSVTIADEYALFTAAQTEICKNTAANFTATSANTPPAIVSYDWDFGDGGTGSGATVSHVYVAAGLYTVRLIITDVNGCRDTLVKNQYIKVNGPTADFNPSVPGSCLMTAINFTDLSVTDGTHPINQWHWYYGDGINETLTAPPFQHAYSAAGIYSVALVVTDSYGCTDSISKINILTISTPAALFASIDTVSCPGKPIVFSNASTGPGLQYLWDFGDGTSANSATPTHAYAADGLYTVQLTVTDIYGCISSLALPQYIRIATPVAAFSVSDSASTCPPLIVQFTNESQNMQTFVWDFGDGNTSTSQSPSHFYNQPGIFIATLTITSPGGCVSVKTKTMSVRGPSGTFTYAPLTGCNPLTVNFTATTLNRDSFIWDFNDGTTLATTDSVLSHTYTTPGLYVPKMILKDIAGCTVAVTGPDTIKVNGVLADFSVDTLLRCNSGNVTFTNASLSNDVITGYLWNFGDGSTSTDFSPTHFYASPGLYTTTLTVTTQTGCVNTVSGPLPVKVVLTPSITFSQSPNGCVPLTMNFTGNLLNADTSAITWNWSYSDGRVSTGQNSPALIFATGGIYDAQLIAINSSGCRDTSNNSFEAYAKPTIVTGQDFSICAGSGQTISATGGVSYTWSPAAGLSCINCPSPVATPDSARDYIVTGTSLQGCTNTVLFM